MHVNQTKTVGNNTVLWADENGQFGTLYCTSGLKSAAIGQWVMPNGEEVAEDGSFKVVHGGGDSFGFAGLQLNPGYTINPGNQGMYKCAIPDDKGKTEELFIGLYPHDYFGEYLFIISAHKYCIELSAESPTISLRVEKPSPDLTLLCASSTSPATSVQWLYKHDIQYAIGPPHFSLASRLSDAESATYENTAMFVAEFDPDVHSGLYFCTITSSYVSTKFNGGESYTTSGKV